VCFHRFVERINLTRSNFSENITVELVADPDGEEFKKLGAGKTVSLRAKIIKSTRDSKTVATRYNYAEGRAKIVKIGNPEFLEIPENRMVTIEFTSGSKYPDLK
jgi:hypothetical protein